MKQQRPRDTTLLSAASANNRATMQEHVAEVIKVKRELLTVGLVLPRHIREQGRPPK